MTTPLDAFVRDFDARERHGVTVRAPASLVYQVARQFDMQSVFLVRAIFWLRGKLMRAAPVGIFSIRWLLLPAIRRRAEADYRQLRESGGS
jgi:hypothetical protein